MAIISTTLPKTLKFTPLSERGEEKPFSLSIRALPPRQFSILEDKMAKINNDESISFTTGSFNWAVIKAGIMDWENLLTEDGTQIKPTKNSKGEVEDNSLDLLPLEIIVEVANTIVSISKDPDNVDLYLGNFPKHEKPESN